MKFSRIVYLVLLLIPMICNVVFLYNESYFNNKFWRAFPAYKNNTTYSLVWIMNIRFVFTYFIFHAILLAFSLFQLCPSAVPLAKIVHRGLLFIKIPFLIGFFFLSFVFPNKSMENFQYLAFALGGLFGFIMPIMLMEVGYVAHNKLMNLHVAVRVMAFAIFIAFYGMAVACYVFTYLASDNINVTVLTSIAIIINAVVFIVSLISKVTSCFPVSFLVLLSGFSFVFAANFDFPTLLGDNNTFNKDCYYAWAAISVVFTLLTLVFINTTELSIKPLFNGTNPAGNPEFGSMISDAGDDDMRSQDSSYHYWAFHLIVIGALGYLALFTTYPTTKDSRLTHYYCMGLSNIGASIVALWTELLPLVAKNRSFL